MFVVVALSVINICYLPAGGRIEKDFALVLSTTRGRRPKAVSRPSAKVFSIQTDQSRQITFLFIFFLF